MKKFATLTALAIMLALPSAVRATVLTMVGDVSNASTASPPPAGGTAYVALGNGSTIVTQYGDRVAGPTQSDVSTADFPGLTYWYNFSYGNNGEGYTPNVVVDKQVHVVSGSG